MLLKMWLCFSWIGPFSNSFVSGVELSLGCSRCYRHQTSWACCSAMQNISTNALAFSVIRALWQTNQAFAGWAETCCYRVSWAIAHRYVLRAQQRRPKYKTFQFLQILLSTVSDTNPLHILDWSKVTLWLWCVCLQFIEIVATRMQLKSRALSLSAAVAMQVHFMVIVTATVVALVIAWFWTPANLLNKRSFACCKEASYMPPLAPHVLLLQ